MRHETITNLLWHHSESYQLAVADQEHAFPVGMELDANISISVTAGMLTSTVCLAHGLASGKLVPTIFIALSS